MNFANSFLRFLKLKGLFLVRGDDNPDTLRFFQIGIYVWVLFSTMLLLPAHEEFWSSKSFITHKAYVGPERLLELLSEPWFESFYPWFLVLQITFILLKIFGFGGRIASFFIWFLTLNLDNRAWVTLDGGNNLIHLLLFFLIFADPLSLDEPNSFDRPIRNLVNNLVLLSCRIQVVIVYLGAGLTKITGVLWQKGVALYYVLQTDEYSHPWVKDLVPHFPFLIVIGTYATIAFQLSFPWLIWNKKARPFLILIGTFIHIQIALVMGLMLFGFAMCASYLCFTPNATAKKWSMRFQIWIGYLGIIIPRSVSLAKIAIPKKFSCKSKNPVGDQVLDH